MGVDLVLELCSLLSLKLNLRLETIDLHVQVLYIVDLFLIPVQLFYKLTHGFLMFMVLRQQLPL